MKTFWTHPQYGATLNSLLEASQGNEKAKAKLLELIDKYGGEAKGGLGIDKEKVIHFEEIDEERITSDTFESHVASNRTKGTIDLTPTWEETTRVALTLLESGSEEGKRMAKAELFKMARLADEYVKIVKKRINTKRNETK